MVNKVTSISGRETQKNMLGVSRVFNHSFVTWLEKLKFMNFCFVLSAKIIENRQTTKNFNFCPNATKWKLDFMQVFWSMWVFAHTSKAWTPCENVLVRTTKQKAAIRMTSHFQLKPLFFYYVGSKVQNFPATSF